MNNAKIIDKRNDQILWEGLNTVQAIADARQQLYRDGYQDKHLEIVLPSPGKYHVYGTSRRTFEKTQPFSKEDIELANKGTWTITPK